MPPHCAIVPIALMHPAYPHREKWDAGCVPSPICAVALRPKAC